MRGAASACPQPRRRRLRRALWVILAALAAGGALWYALIEHLPLAQPPRPPQPVPAELAAALACDPSLPLQVELDPPSVREGLEVVRGRLTVRRPEAAAPHQAVFDWFGARAAARPAPAVVITPILGGDNAIANRMAGYLARRGLHGIVVHRPPPEQVEPRLEAWEELLRDLIADRRRVIDWLVAQPQVDPERIGAFGVSLGGITTLALAAVERRVRAAVAVMAGGDLAAIIARSVEGPCVELRRAYGLGEGAGPEQREAFEHRARAVLQTDPLRLAPHLDPRRVLLFITRRDRSVPTQTQLRLRAALGQPESWSLPTGHYSAVLYLPFIEHKAYTFLAERLSAPLDSSQHGS
ncbi:MAG: hypothetical protein KatS3mg102_2749 [Planctomycetota bacterium]|nr:MAG: hypothetical protein KatS3mg102_2749 [Planctomycetota bacterium]